MNLGRLLSSSAVDFLRRQQRDWKITVARTSLDRFAYQIIFPYLSLYIVALGATATELGFVNSLGMIAAGVISPFTGWFIDRSGPKKIYLLGIGFLAISYLTYANASRRAGTQRTARSPSHSRRRNDWDGQSGYGCWCRVWKAPPPRLSRPRNKV